MIAAEIYKQGDGKIVGFVLRGHSDRNGAHGHGYNIGCAKVSVLSSAAYLGVLKYLNRDAEANDEHGGLGLKLTGAPDDVTEAVFRTMLIGLRAVEKAAPNVVKVKLIPMTEAAAANLQSKIDAMNPTPSKPLPKLNVDEIRIRADFYRNAAGKVTGFSINERKDKIVAEVAIYRAGIWALTKATVACVKDYLKRAVNLESGSRKLTAELTDAPDDVTEAVFRTMLIGLREIERQAPQIIRVNEFSHGGES